MRGWNDVLKEYEDVMRGKIAGGGEFTRYWVCIMYYNTDEEPVITSGKTTHHITEYARLIEKGKMNASWQVMPGVHQLYAAGLTMQDAIHYLSTALETGKDSDGNAI